MIDAIEIKTNLGTMGYIEMIKLMALRLSKNLDIPQYSGLWRYTGTIDPGRSIDEYQFLCEQGIIENDPDPLGRELAYALDRVILWRVHLALTLIEHALVGMGPSYKDGPIVLAGDWSIVSQEVFSGFLFSMWTTVKYHSMKLAIDCTYVDDDDERMKFARILREANAR